jgi:UDP-N-acetylglucosamine acyltransferase
VAGHVHVGNHVNIAWNAGIHQFCNIGDYAMLAACSKCVQDVPPYMIADGNPAETKMVNVVGITRAGFSPEEINSAKNMYKLFYRDGLNTSQAIEKAKGDSQNRVTQNFIAFAQATKRGLA